ncbi:MAG: HD-GYP domain-containing protein [Thermanaerothrix sp.]|nr:HD-GYP domain-containing protein [Thermanaerothrix sp.]
MTSFKWLFVRWFWFFASLGAFMLFLQGAYLFRSALRDQQRNAWNATESMASNLVRHLDSELVKASYIAAAPYKAETYFPEVELLVRILEDQAEEPFRGYIPHGVRLRELDRLRGVWEVSSLYNPDGYPQFVTVRELEGSEYLVGIRMDENALGFKGSSLVLPVLAGEDGRVIWAEDGPFGRYFSIRGWIDRRMLNCESWSRGRIDDGRAYWAKCFRVQGMRLLVVVPEGEILVKVLSGSAVPIAMSFMMLGILFLFYRLWKNQVMPDVKDMTDFFEKMERDLSTIRCPEDLSQVIDALSQDVERRKSRCNLEELHSVLSGLGAAMRVLWSQQEEINAFGEEVAAMNASLAESNDILRKREQIWGQTLQVAKLVRSGYQAPDEVGRIAETIREMLSAFGVVVDRLEGDTLIPVAYSGYEEGLPPEPVNVHSSLIGRAVKEGLIWAEDVRSEAGYLTLHEAVVTEVAMGLSHMGRPVGGLTVSFTERRKRDEAMLETLIPVASVLAGFLDASKSRQEIRESYYYLAQKLQEITGIYHNETEEHLSRIGAYVTRIARDLGRSPQEVEDMGIFARLHDIGKLKVPHHVLSKPSGLTSEEFEMVKRHTVWGAEIIGDAEWLAMARRVCLTHHEKWDGSGYPFGLSGQQIPWEGRVMALADIYDALRSNRSYKRGFSHEEAVRVILMGDGRTRPEHFAPEVLEWFRQNHEVMGSIFDRFRDREE